MKITINPSGDVELEVTNGDGHAAMEMIRQLRAEAKTETTAPAIDVQNKLSSLTVKQRETYEAIKQLDSPDGVHVSGVAVVLGISESTSSYRCGVLHHRGLVDQITKGHYRAVTS